MLSVRPKLKALTLRLRAPAGPVKMPLAQAHPFEPMPVTHEETQDQEVSFASIVYIVLIEKLASCHSIQPV